jgi:hypothetical protein
MAGTVNLVVLKHFDFNIRKLVTSDEPLNQNFREYLITSFENHKPNCQASRAPPNEMCWPAIIAQEQLHIYVGFEVITAVTIKRTIFWDVTPCSPVKVKHFHLQSQSAFSLDLIFDRGSAIAQAASRRLPTAAALVRAQVRSCGICDG